MRACVVDALVIGAGPAGLMAAEELAKAGRRVVVCEGKSSPGRKFLMAGKSGLNITKDQDFSAFSASYRCPELAPMLAQWRLPLPLLDDLLSAFMQDVDYTAQGRWYADEAELLDYCRRSANPIGRLLLHLYGIDDAPSLAHSDAICSALQLINFWQDLSVDLPRGRWYLPLADCRTHGLSPEDFKAFRPLAPAPPAQCAIDLVANEVRWARALMLQGAPLVHRIPGRAGWELRLVVQGGLRILDKIEALGCDTFSARPTVGKADAPLLLWRALRMPRHPDNRHR